MGSPKESIFSRAQERLRTRLAQETHEDRLTPSWSSTPASSIAIPASVLAATLNSSGDASGSGSIVNNEIDFYQFNATAGKFAISATTPSSNMDTVIGLYDAAGQRVAFNDNVSAANHDSKLNITLTSGTYYLGVTNLTGTPGGTYDWSINCPNIKSPPPPVSDKAVGGKAATNTALPFPLFPAKQWLPVNRPERSNSRSGINRPPRHRSASLGRHPTPVSLPHRGSSLAVLERIEPLRLRPLPGNPERQRSRSP